jgi:hypothetical protein
VLVGEEVRASGYHLIAVGIERRVSWDQPAAAAIDDVHGQGGVAIAAHPVAMYWPAWDEAAIAKLDGSEVVHPSAYLRASAGIQMARFWAGRPLTAVGSSDYHGLGRLGLCRTYVFARGEGEAAILDALRDRRTVVRDRDGRLYGRPDLVGLAAADGRLWAREAPPERSGMAFATARLAGIAALVGFVVFGLPSDRR